MRHLCGHMNTIFGVSVWEWLVFSGQFEICIWGEGSTTQQGVHGGPTFPVKVNHMPVYGLVTIHSRGEYIMTIHHTQNVKCILHINTYKTHI